MARRDHRRRSKRPVGAIAFPMRVLARLAQRSTTPKGRDVDSKIGASVFLFLWSFSHD